MWKQKSTAQAIVVPCSAENSLAIGGRNGYNIPAVQKILLHRAVRRLLQAVGSWRSLPLPCYFVFHGCIIPHPKMGVQPALDPFEKVF